MSKTAPPPETPQPLQPAKTAILVFHGMGQQVPFETLGMVAGKISEKAGWESHPPMISNVSLKGGQGTSSSTITKITAGPDGERVDFFESYWAPITEGKVSIIDAVVFLLEGGWAGLKFDLKKINERGNRKFTRFYWKGKFGFELDVLQNWLLLVVPMAVIIGLASLAAVLMHGFKSGEWRPALERVSFLFRVLHFLLLPAIIGYMILKPGVHKGKVPAKTKWTVLRMPFAFLNNNKYLVVAVLLGILQTPGIFRQLEKDKPWGWLDWLQMGPLSVLAGVVSWIKGVADFVGLFLYDIAAKFVPDFLGIGAWIKDGIPGRKALGDLLTFLFQERGDASRNGWFHALNWSLNIDVLLLVIAVLLGLLSMLPWSPKRIWLRLLLRPIPVYVRIIWLQSLAALSAIFIGGIAIPVLIAKGGSNSVAMGNNFLIFVYGGLGLFVLYKLNFFLVEYFGDVAAYLSSHKASKFAEIRAKIQAEGFKTACHVYDSGYDHIIIVGHSLGSVIAYDTLNGIISHDAINNGQQWAAAKKTRLLLTFGSPLDKTAFVFRVQVKGENRMREVLAASKQPLLQEDHLYRPESWVNVWSRNDIISGPLNFYDLGMVKPGADSITPATPQTEFKFHPFAREREDAQVPYCPDLPISENPDLNPVGGVRPVISLIDPKADVPYAAHTQYWENDLIYEIILNALKGNLIRVTKST